ncbi:MAG: CHAP domain-containing protein [Clostridia bacterium]|nr:CHAP domain-containing protein [Clostridia bacterium]
MKRTRLTRWIGLLLSLHLFSLAALPAAALTPAYPITGSYLSSTYHENLLKLPRTGDRAFDTVAVALSQLDYHEGNSTADFDGENGNGSRNYTEYNYAYGQVGGTYGYAWCAAFASWCLEQADAAGAAGGLFVSCTLWVERLQALGQYSTRSSGYTPKTGDLIFFRSAGVARASDHVGLVRYVKGGRVYTVEGNSSDRVSLRDYALKDSYIVGYGKPAYRSSFSLPKTALECEDKVVGWYTVTNDFLNIRAAASSSASKRGTLDKGDMVRVLSIKNGWGAFYYKEKLSYISLDYADFTSPSSYRVRYDAAGGENAPATVSYLSMESAAVSAKTPTREGYLFLGWQDGAGKQYKAGDALPVADTTLIAVWELIPVAEEPTLPDEPEAPSGDDTAQGEGDEFLTPVPGDTAPEALVPVAPSTPVESANAAAIAAGVAVSLLTASLGGWWLYVWQKRRREEED